MNRRELTISTKRSIIHEIGKTESMMDSAIKKLTNDSEKQRKIKEIAHSIQPSNFNDLNRIYHIPHRYLYSEVDTPFKCIKSAGYNDKTYINILNHKEDVEIANVLNTSPQHYFASIRHSHSRTFIDYKYTRTRCMKKLIDVMVLDLLTAKYIHTIKYIRIEAKSNRPPMFWNTFNLGSY